MKNNLTGRASVLPFKNLIMYKILTGSRKGELIVKPQNVSVMKRLIEKGLICEVKEEKQERETKEEKFVPKTKEVKHRVSRKRKN